MSNRTLLCLALSCWSCCPCYPSDCSHDIARLDRISMDLAISHTNSVNSAPRALQVWCKSRPSAAPSTCSSSIPSSKVEQTQSFSERQYMIVYVQASLSMCQVRLTYSKESSSIKPTVLRAHHARAYVISVYLPATRENIKLDSPQVYNSNVAHVSDSAVGAWIMAL